MGKRLSIRHVVWNSCKHTKYVWENVTVEEIILWVKLK